MKKDIGAVVGLYPTPVTIVGTEVDGRVNWINIAHIGIWGVDKMLLSIAKAHYSNRGIKQNKALSLNLVDEAMLVAADYVGLVSGHKVDKSGVFKYVQGTLKGAPLIVQAPVSMECKVVELHETETHDMFIVRPVHTHVKEAVLSADGRIDYEKVKPVLFEMPNRQYLSTGKVVGPCWQLGNSFSKAE